MKKSMSSLLLILCFLLLTTACGDDSNNRDNNTAANNTNNVNNSTSDPLPTLDEFISSVVTARATNLCRTVFACPYQTTPDQIAIIGSLGSLEACIQHYEYQISNNGFPNIKASITAGRTLYNAEKATACLTRLHTANETCERSEETTYNIDQACEAVFTGTLESGAECAAQTECLNGTCSPGMCPGICFPNLPSAQLGESCEEAYCAPGLRCTYNIYDPEIDTPTCVEPTIIPKGADCTDPATICESPLICDLREGICADAPIIAKPNGPCDNETSFCGGGLYCDSASLTCKPLGPLNASCLTTSQCLAGLFCSSEDLTCQPMRQLNEPCDMSQESTHCTTGLRCTQDPDTQTFSCQDPHQSPKICEL